MSKQARPPQYKKDNSLYLDIDIDFAGVIKTNPAPFTSKMLVPEDRVQKILFTPLLKYTDDIIKKAGVPISYRSFLEKSLYFTKLLKYVIKNKKVPKYGSPAARTNGAHNIKYMLELMFKPETPIYIKDHKYIIQKFVIHTPATPSDLRIGEPVSAKVSVYLAMIEDHKNNFDRLDCKDKRRDIMDSIHKFFYPDDEVLVQDYRITRRGLPMLPPSYHSETTGYVKSKAINDDGDISSHAHSHYGRGLQDIYGSQLSRHHMPYSSSASRHHMPYASSASRHHGSSASRHHGSSASRHHGSSASSASRHHGTSASSASRHHGTSASSASRHHGTSASSASRLYKRSRGGGTKKKGKKSKKRKSTRCKSRRAN